MPGIWPRGHAGKPSTCKSRCGGRTREIKKSRRPMSRQSRRSRERRTSRERTDYTLAAGIYRILIDSWDEDRAVVSMLTFGKIDLEAGLKTCGNALRQQDVRRELKAGNFKKAIGLCQAALKERPGDGSVRADYAAALLEIKAAGDKALAGRDFAAAGRIDGLLLKNVKSFEELGGMEKPAAAALNKERLIEAIKACSLGLTNQGLAEYRKGNLEKAIAVWEALLVFDPENAEIKKAVETARAQLGKLKKIG
ncbi:MAG: tetratricopeptide repeat protein [Ignavibacteriales bacterium]|nr:tetratricopeptide repeat protein [Ignavibacteriales bacterium]